jgi:hypothetical protein
VIVRSQEKLMPNAGDRLKRQARFALQPQRSTVVDFGSAKRAASNAPIYRFSIIDRLTAHGWAQAGGELGYTRLAFEPAAEIDGASHGEYLLIYPRDSAWSAWGIGCDTEGFTLWHAPRGTTIGRFRTMQDALDRIQSITFVG